MGPDVARGPGGLLRLSRGGRRARPYLCCCLLHYFNAKPYDMPDLFEGSLQELVTPLTFQCLSLD